MLNIFKTMVTDDGILEKSDVYILGRMKEFASNEDVVNIAAAKQLLILIERSVRSKPLLPSQLYSQNIYSKRAARCRSRLLQSPSLLRHR